MLSATALPLLPREARGPREIVPVEAALTGDGGEPDGAAEGLTAAGRAASARAPWAPIAAPFGTIEVRSATMTVAMI